MTAAEFCSDLVGKRIRWKGWRHDEWFLVKRAWAVNVDSPGTQTRVKVVGRFPGDTIDDYFIVDDSEVRQWEVRDTKPELIVSHMPSWF